MEPTRVLHGHCTLRQALQFINDHQQDPETWTAKKIADDYKLKEAHVGKLIDLQIGISIFYNTLYLRSKHSALLQDLQRVYTWEAVQGKVAVPGQAEVAKWQANSRGQRQ